MLVRFIRDESGIALGLAVIIILLVGVMGAGLLVFVRNDLEAVVEVNKGQKAFDIADSGVQVAKQQILSDATRQHYDRDHTNDCNPEIRLEAEDWSPSTTVYENPDCTGAEVEREPGVTRNFAGGKFNVTIQCLQQPDGPTGGTDTCSGVTEDAPGSVQASEQTYFKATSTGYYPADESGARRKIEVIYSTYELDVPKGFYSPNDIEVKDTASIRNVSLFSRADVTVSEGATIQGEDLSYGNWRNEINPTARSVEAAGIGTTRTIYGSPEEGRDFDNGTDPQMVTPAELGDPGSQGDQITFPFDPAQQPDLDLLRDIAKSQENYHEFSTGPKSVGDDAGAGVEWPDDSSLNTVVFVEYTRSGNNEVSWDVGDSCSEDPEKGILVVENGSFNTTQNTAPLEGAMIVRGGDYTDGESNDTAGNTCLNGFVNATGTIEISGDVELSAASNATNRPGFYGVRQWSWRECYTEDCN